MDSMSITMAAQPTPNLRQREKAAGSRTIDQLTRELYLEREIRRKLESQVEELRAKALFADSVCASKNSILVGSLAKLLRQNGFVIGRNRLFGLLRQQGYLCGGEGDQHNIPTQKSMDKGLFEIQEHTVTKADGSARITKTTMVTGKGQVYFINRFCGQNPEK